MTLQEYIEVQCKTFERLALPGKDKMTESDAAYLRGMRASKHIVTYFEGNRLAEYRVIDEVEATVMDLPGVINKYHALGYFVEVSLIDTRKLPALDLAAYKVTVLKAVE